MKKLFLLLSMLVTYLQLIAVDYTVVIPVAYDQTKKEWNVLLGLDSDDEWTFFYKAMEPNKEKANRQGQSVLKTQTNNVYDIQITSVPWGKIQGDFGHTYFVHLVPVKFIPGKELYSTAKNKYRVDFAWTSAEDLSKSGTFKHKNIEEGIESPFGKFFKYIWQEKKGELVVPAKASTTQPQQGPWTEYAPQASSWNIKGAILFYKSDQQYYEFTNFYERAVHVDGKSWPTTEQYYQAMKYIEDATLDADLTFMGMFIKKGANIRETIRNFKSDNYGSGPRKAFDIKNHIPANKVRTDWKQVSLGIMEKAVRAKFTEHADLKKLLVSTDDTILVENAGAKDAFYGAGADYKGENYLGRILMKIRKELQGGSRSAIQNGLMNSLQQLAHMLDMLSGQLTT